MATVKLKIFVAELTNVLTLYDSIQVQRSVTAPPTVDEVDLTADPPAPAVLVGEEEGPYLINGSTLTFKVNGTEVTATFVSPSPVALPDVIDEVNTALSNAGLAATASDSGDGELQLETNDTGTLRTLEIISGTALTELGFTAGDKDNGEDPYITLVPGVENYEYDDGSGQASYWYRTRFYHTTNGVFSGWSDWIQGLTSAAVDSANLIVGKVQLAALDGAALSGKKVTVVNVFESNIVDGFGVFGKSIELETDGAGMAETTLVKGSLIDVVFSGTSVIRRIRVPDTGTEFDLLDDSLVVGDALEIIRPDLPYAPRRS